MYVNLVIHSDMWKVTFYVESNRETQKQTTCFSLNPWL
jgi:hypothetical protein